MERLELEHLINTVPRNRLRFSQDNSEQDTNKQIFYKFHRTDIIELFSFPPSPPALTLTGFQTLSGSEIKI